MAKARRWADLTTTDFAALDPETTVAVLPVGAVEQHGPHLPLNTDACIAEAVAERAAAAVAHLPVYLLPTQAVGKSNEHIDFPGTLTLSTETLLHLWTEIGESVHRAGVRKLLFLNSHGGQYQVMEIVARELRVRHAMMCVSSSWWQMGLPDNLINPDEIRHGIHGGTVETSMMLHLRPDLVNMEQAANFRPVMAELEGVYKKLQYLGGISIGWQAQDIHPAGVAGDASQATPEIGAQIVSHAVEQLAQLLTEVSTHPLSFLRTCEF